MRDLTVDEIARLGALPAEADEPFHMTEEAFPKATGTLDEFMFGANGFG